VEPRVTEPSGKPNGHTAEAVEAAVAQLAQPIRRRPKMVRIKLQSVSIEVPAREQPQQRGGERSRP